MHTLVASLPALDPAGAQPRSDVTYVGPVVSFSPRTAADPAVLVSLSTIKFPKMRESLQKVLDATAGLDARVVVTTGPVIDPASLRPAANHELHRFVPHAELMPSMSLVVGHGGHSTTMQALAHDLPMVVMPMHPMLDQRMVGQSLERAGAGRLVSKRTSVEDLRAAVTDLLADGPHRAGGCAPRRRRSGPCPARSTAPTRWRPCSETEQGRQVAARLDRELVHAEPPGEPDQLGGQLLGRLHRRTRFGVRRLHDEAPGLPVGLEVDPADDLLAEQEREHVVAVDAVCGAGV